ncbi:hypothetical protein MC885_005663 [Smutsia gigantea]|nr:hypothetical protein MC885_005663 [Smutsia gigantea]
MVLPTQPESKAARVNLNEIDQRLKVFTVRSLVQVILSKLQTRTASDTAAIVIVYRDLISHEDMFSDICKIREIRNRLCLEVEGKVVSRTEGNTDDSSRSFTRGAYCKYIKDRMKSIKGKREEQRPERVKPFMTGAAKQSKHVLANFRNYQFLIGESVSPDGMITLLDCHEDGVTPYRIFFKDGLEMGKR